VIQGNTLLQGSEYTYTLTCTNTNGVAVFASILVTTNGAPGLFTVVALVGTELTDLFTLSASQWQDSDIPITYSFG